jgi:hypothetical protein
MKLRIWVNSIDNKLNTNFSFLSKFESICYYLECNFTSIYNIIYKHVLKKNLK